MMITKQDIENAARELCKSSLQPHECYYSFIAGAEWALNLTKKDFELLERNTRSNYISKQEADQVRKIRLEFTRWGE